MSPDYRAMKVAHYPFYDFWQDVLINIPLLVAKKVFVIFPCFIAKYVYDKIHEIDAVKTQSQAIKSLASKLTQHKVPFSYNGEDKISTDESLIEFSGTEVVATHFSRRNCYQVTLKDDVESITDKIATTLSSLTGKNNITC